MIGSVFNQGDSWFMRIRDIIFRDFRSFRGEKRVSFVDPLTDQVRPITVIAGTNGTGKTTILDTIEGLLKFVQLKLQAQPPNPAIQVEFISEIYETRHTIQSSVSMSVEFSAADLLQPLTNEPETLNVIIGNRGTNDSSHFIGRFWPNFQVEISNTSLIEELRQVMVNQRKDPQYGGLLYFPHNRQLASLSGGVIEPPPTNKNEWLFRFSNADQWKGSLEQFWVWQNYLDLEEGTAHQQLESFVKTVENILGDDRRITVQKGRARVSVPWSMNGNGEKVSLNQLPSGEQKILLLFGELTRRRRSGIVIAIDEPESSLHPTLQRRVVHQLRQIANEWNAQIILATHSLEILQSVHESEILFLDQLSAPTPSLVVDE
jgi:energy-coupling factor transporter ATP-binding protein EcfA2